jgi:hypothetical protein
MVSQLMKEVPKGTRIWVTSDHGMINVEEMIILGQDNPLLTGVNVVAGEPRARHIYLTEDSVQARVDAAGIWQQYLQDKALVLTREEAISSDLFGAALSADSIDRMGEVIAIARGGLILVEAARVDKEGAMVGHHGADSDIESHVGLLTTNWASCLKLLLTVLWLDAKHNFIPAWNLGTRSDAITCGFIIWFFTNNC